MDVDEAYASMRVKQVETYLHDLEAWRGGDTERFGRMIVDHGNHCGASPEKWAQYIVNVAADERVAERHDERMQVVLHWLFEAGLLGAAH